MQIKWEINSCRLDSGWIGKTFSGQWYSNHLPYVYNEMRIIFCICCQWVGVENTLSMAVSVYAWKLLFQDTRDEILSKSWRLKRLPRNLGFGSAIVQIKWFKLVNLFSQNNIRIIYVWIESPDVIYREKTNGFFFSLFPSLPSFIKASHHSSLRSTKSPNIKALSQIDPKRAEEELTSKTSNARKRKSGNKERISSSAAYQWIYYPRRIIINYTKANSALKSS